MLKLKNLRARPDLKLVQLEITNLFPDVPPSHKVAAGATKLALFEMGRTIDLTIEPFKLFPCIDCSDILIEYFP